MNLMNTEKNVIRTRENLCHVASQKLHQNSVLAMSNLLNANIDTGLMYAIGETNIWPVQRADILYDVN